MARTLGTPEHPLPHLRAHRDRESIEQWFIEWSSVTRLAKTYGLTPDSIYRHAHATGLFEKRQRNIRRALERIIEQPVEDVQANAPAVVSAIQTYTKLNARGEWDATPGWCWPEGAVGPDEY